MGISVDHAIPLADSWIGLVKRPWMLIVALFMYLFWGTGAFTVPPVEVAAFMRSELIDDKGNYIAPIGKQDPRDPNNCPDFEIMVVSANVINNAVFIIIHRLPPPTHPRRVLTGRKAPWRTSSRF